MNTRLPRPEDTVICRCEAVTLGQVQAAVAEGYLSPTEVKARTRAGMGLCQGRTCRGLVTRAVAASRGADPAALAPISYRPPVRPVSLDDLAAVGTVNGDG